MMLANVQWEYEGTNSIFVLVGPPGSYYIDFVLELPTTLTSGRVVAVVKPREMQLSLTRFVVHIPPIDAPLSGIFHLSIFDDGEVGLSLVSTTDEREVHALARDHDDFVRRVLWLLAVTLA